MTDEEAVRKIADSVGAWDVLVLNAGYLPAPTPAAKADVGDYWKAYEVRRLLFICTVSISNLQKDQCEVRNHFCKVLLPNGEPDKGFTARGDQWIDCDADEDACWSLSLPELKTCAHQDGGISVR